MCSSELVTQAMEKLGIQTGHGGVPRGPHHGKPLVFKAGRIGEEVVLEAGFSRSKSKHSLGCKTLTRDQALGRERRSVRMSEEEGALPCRLQLSQVRGPRGCPLECLSVPHQADMAMHLLPHPPRSPAVGCSGKA